MVVSSLLSNILFSLMLKIWHRQLVAYPNTVFFLLSDKTLVFNWSHCNLEENQLPVEVVFGKGFFKRWLKKLKKEVAYLNNISFLLSDLILLM